MDTATTQDLKWITAAACKGHDLNIWFESNGQDEQSKAKQQLAKKICQSCSVRISCLNYALRHEQYGIWGGFSSQEREQIRRKKNIHLIPRRPV